MYVCSSRILSLSVTSCPSLEKRWHFFSRRSVIRSPACDSLFFGSFGPQSSRERKSEYLSDGVGDGVHALEGSFVVY